MRTFNIVAVLFGIVALSCNKPQPSKKSEPGEVSTTAPSADKKALLQETIINVIDAYAAKDETALNTYVSKDEGIIVLYRVGVFNEYKRIAAFDFENPVPPNFKYPPVHKMAALQYGTLPKFDCGSMAWDKHGLYCDTIHKDTLLSGALENLRKYRGDKIPQPEIDKLKKLESKSVRVVLAINDTDSFIFYLTFINNRWYVTGHDRITTDCSA